MIKHKISLLLLTLIFSFSALAIEDDIKIGECNYSNDASKYISASVKENSKCLYEALELETEYNKQNKKVFSDFSVKLKSSYDTIKPYMAILLALLIIYKIYVFSNQRNHEKENKGSTNALFKVAIFSLAAMIMAEAKLIQEISDKSLNMIFHNMNLPLAVNNHLEEQSEAVKLHAIEANRTIIADKLVDISQSMFNSEMCAISYRTNLMSFNSFDDLNELPANPVLNCIEEFKEENSTKTIAEMGNRMLHSAAINHCSQYSESSHLIDCGRQYTSNSSQEVVNVINKYSVEFAKLANQFHAINCVSLKLKNEDQYESFCRDFKDDYFYLIESDKTLSDFDTNFTSKFESFVSEYSDALQIEIDIELDKKDVGKVETQRKMTSVYDQALEAFTVKNKDKAYGDIIKDRVNGLLYVEPFRRDLESGRILNKHLTDYTVFETVDDYFNYLNHSSVQYFENVNDFVSNLLNQYKWITDQKLLVGKYTDSANTEFKINSDVLLSLQENKTSFLTVGTIIKISVAVAKRSNRAFGNLDTIDTLGSICIFLSFYKEILTVTFISIGYALFLPMIITALILISIKLLSSIFLKIDIIYLGDEINDIYFNVQNISMSLLISIAATSLFMNVIQHLIDNVLVFNEGYKTVMALLNIPTYLVIAILLIVVQMYLMYWTYNHINSKSKSKSENIKDNPKSLALKGKRMLRL